MRIPRMLLALSSLLHVSAAIAHASAFPRAAAVLAGAHVAPVYAGMFKSLFLSDSTTLTIIAAVVAFLAARPATATRTLVVLVALVSAATGAMVFIFMGGFFAGYWMVAASLTAIAAAPMIR